MGIPGYYTQEFRVPGALAGTADGFLNASATSYLSFRAGVHHSIRGNTDFTMELTDANGSKVYFDLDRLGGLTETYAAQVYLRPLIGVLPGGTTDLRKTSFQTYRIDLSALRYNSRIFDSSKISSVRFIFDQTQTGRAIFDDLEFAN